GRAARLVPGRPLARPRRARRVHGADRGARGRAPRPHAGRPGPACRPDRAGPRRGARGDDRHGRGARDPLGDRRVGRAHVPRRPHRRRVRGHRDRPRRGPARLPGGGRGPRARGDAGPGARVTRAAAATGAVPTVSVVVPVRDDAVALDRCLALLARQTVAPLEVVVVDNASRDDSALVARRWGAVVVREDHVGIPAAAATGYDAARGDVIARLDADSQPDARWVERVVDRMADDPSLDAMTGTGVFHDLPRGVRTAVAVAYLGAYYVLCHLALGHTALWGSCMALRRTAWAAVRDAVVRDDPEVHDDLDLSFRLGPRRRAVLDRSWRVGVSARSLRGR